MFFLSANGARLRRNAGCAVALLLAVAGVLISAVAARADCAPGMVPTVDDMCMPAGNMDCGVGRGSCAPGTVCMRGHGCMPTGAVDCGDETYASPGGSCTGSAPPASTSATNPPGSCSTITGPGMPSGPANCPPNQPRPVTTVPPPTQTVAPPAPAPRPPNPIDPATQAAQQLFDLLNIPVPQLQPVTPDRETEARAAFDKGQAAYNAHDCATALQYFNESVSLTVSYGSTYAGWRDRAQACTGQPGSPAPVATYLVPAEVPTPPATTPAGTPDLLAQRRQRCEDLERQGQIAAVSCWGGFADLAAQMSQPALAKWANEHASALNKNGPQGCQAQATMPIAPGCNFDYPLRLTGAACNAADNSVGWVAQVPGGEQACCVKSTLKCQLEQSLRQ